MGEQTVSNFIISLILVGGIIATIAIYYAGAATSTGRTYDNNTFAVYNQLGAINSTAEQIKNNMENMNQGGITDYVSGFFKGGWQILTVTWQSFGVFTSMSNDATRQITTAIPGTTILLGAIIMAVFVAFAFLFVSAIMGRKL